MEFNKASSSILPKNPLIVSDCRAYALIDGRLLQITTDHTKYQNLIKSGEYKPQELRNHKERLSSVLTSAIAKDFSLNYQSLSIRTNEILADGFVTIYLMSDGAYHHWDKRKRFSDNTMRSPASFSSSLKKRIEKDITDDYSFVGVKIRVT